MQWNAVRNLMDNINTEMQYNAMFYNKQFFSDNIPTASMHICKSLLHVPLMTSLLRAHAATVLYAYTKY